ncbi:ABC transporter permease [Planomicrobium sp. YIM 101495]|uniref:ABC transporter permease n=1 Tax=Planomicrobium sp. YIM 101495 TaxID=2665160 RepID=UPI0012B8C167|nr:ABC transporter permease [Planomicrobium sp. YIM 101495]MTD30599.1 ABC transporter permease subunit [Planomicrobium sp. YIM 101495]
MNMSIKRINAIFQKDFKDFSRNSAVSVTILFPLIMAFIYKNMDTVTLDTYYLLFNMSFAIIATFIQCCLIAEEKEKNTLRGLMLSPASTTEILAGKSLLTFTVTVIALGLTAWIAGYEPTNMFIITAALGLSTLFYIAVGTLLGLLANSVMEASVIVLPVLGIFSFGSFGLAFAEKYPILQALEYLPSSQLIELARKVEEGAALSTVWPQFAVIAIWIAVAIAATIIVYRKRMVD